MTKFLKFVGHYYWLLIGLAFFCSSSGVFAAEYLSHQHHNNVLRIQTDQGVVSITAKSDTALEVFYQHQGIVQLPSFALIDSIVQPATSLTTDPSYLQFKTKNISAKIQLSPLQIRYFSHGQLLLEEETGAFITETVRGFRFKLQPDEKLMGGGQRVLGMDRRGHRLPLYNRAHYGYTTESNQMYFGLPAVMSNKKYALVFDNSAKGNMDLGHSEKSVMQFDAVGGRTSYIVIAGSTYPELIKNLTEITGRQPLPPRWALGNFASRFGYKTEAQTRETVQQFIDKDFPLDAVVLDLYWFGPDIQGHMGNLDWDKNAFPTPTQMIDDFQALGVETILVTEPFILTTSNKWQDASANNALAINLSGKPKQFDFYFGNTGLVDVFSQAGQDWLAKQYARLAKFGVAGWWGDLGEPEVHPYDLIHQIDGKKYTADELHNVYGHKWAELVFNQLRISNPAYRPFNLMRSGFIGSQRYGMIPWTGDVSRSWGGLKPQVELSLQMSVFGMAYTHSDLGGFAGGEKFDKEMYIRWLQYGVFQPIYRPHAHESIAPEPIFHDQQTQDILRRYIKLRYALLPYNYTLAYQNSMNGMPLMRPMAFEDETNPAYFDLADQYLWGDALLIKPVTNPGQKQLKIELPQGIWFDFWNDHRFEGDQSVQIESNLEHLPVFVRAGSFIPMVHPMQHTKRYNTAKLQIHYYHDQSVESSQYTLFDDDGNDFNSIKLGQFQTLNFQAQATVDNLVISQQTKGQYKGASVNREFVFIIHNWLPANDDMQIKLQHTDNNTTTSLSQVNDINQTIENTFFYDKKLKTLQIKLISSTSFTIHMFVNP